MILSKDKPTIVGRQPNEKSWENLRSLMNFNFIFRVTDRNANKRYLKGFSGLRKMVNDDKLFYKLCDKALTSSKHKPTYLIRNRLRIVFVSK